MSIKVTCTCGKQLKVKDKYAGKTGRCPFCKDLIDIPPKKISDDDIVDLLGPPSPPPPPADEEPVPQPEENDEEEQSALAAHEPGQESGMSLLGSGVVKRQKMCPSCGHFAPHWHASCANCSEYFPPE